MDEGKRAEGEEILRNLMTERGFYPMVAAQKLNATYPVMVAVAAKPRASLTDGPEVARVRELMYWNMDNWPAASGAPTSPAAAGRNKRRWRVTPLNKNGPI